ncbi:uncharacterized protein AKAW2_30840S [Aspergillus luchuensis]|uniref:Uncharacterized protein n=1 Tax=Aspergillus kawachii TaxID=1069201 RepID=A0A7R7ZXX1_ASPKA|nr:uncharacterized protein AKAW2_30840S [Aspergillus luchuensis]BCR97521.1 hypothetical protein AKAW2_30840S [Aspergillus luchuensis]
MIVASPGCAALTLARIACLRSPSLKGHKSVKNIAHTSPWTHLNLSDLPLCGSQSTRQPIGFRTPPTIVAFSEASAFESYLSTTTSPTATSQIRSRTTPRIRLELIPGSAPIVSLPHPGSVYRAVSCSSSRHSHSSDFVLATLATCPNSLMSLTHRFYHRTS